MATFIAGILVGVVGTLAAILVAIYWPNQPERPWDPED
jgi:hypothetical protein